MINDNRINPRVPLNLPVTIILSDDIEVHVRSENISVSGLMISATQAQFQRILYRKLGRKINIHPELALQLRLPRSHQPSLLLKAHCRAIHVRRISQDRYYIGLKFLQISQNGGTAIQDYVERNLELPASPSRPVSSTTAIPDQSKRHKQPLT